MSIKEPNTIDSLDELCANEDTAAETAAASDNSAVPEQSCSRKGFSFGRLMTTLVVLVLAVANIWTFIELLRVDLLVVSVDVSRSQLAMFENEANTLYADIRSYGLSETLGLSEVDVIWTSDAPSVVSVNDDGTIQALSPGTAVITASESRSGIADSCTVTVYNLTDIVLGTQAQSLGTGESFTLEAAVSSNDLAEPFEYSSSDSSVAFVDKNGVITAMSPGETVITVSARGYTPSECTISVLSAPTLITLDAQKAKICIGETRTVSVVNESGEYCSKYTFTSSDPEIISIDDSGKVTALASGTATVSVTAYNGVFTSFEYTVTGEPKSVELDHSKLTVYSGFTETLSPKDSTGSCMEFYYTSSDTSVATVDENGVITAHNRGQAVITCSTFNGKSDTCTVNVKVVDYTLPYTSARVEQNIAVLAASYPDLISTEVIGSSVLGRSITLVKLGTGERKALVAAGMHSREGIGVTFTMRCIEEYAEAYYSKSGKYGSYNVRDMLDEFTLYIVPLMNPDGLDIVNDNLDPIYSGFTAEGFNRAKYKNNANGVNLNRNFPFMWGYSDDKEAVNVTTPDTLSYAGDYAGSEPETQAMMKLCNENEFEWLLDVHCRGNIIYYQDKYNEVTAADNRLASLLSRKCGFTLTDQSTAYEISGGFENWFRSEFGKPGICIELVNSEFSYVVNSRFDDKLNWSKTRYAFLLGMLD